MNILKKCKYGQMIINRRDSWVGDSLDVYGEWSEGEIALIREHVKEGDVVLDIGANIGSHTIPLSQMVGNKGCVLAFEPERGNFYTLCGNVALNNCENVVCFQQGVSNFNGTIKVPFINSVHMTNFGSLELDKDYSKIPHYVVPAIKLDDLGLARCDFIKMDIEGMERLALEGGEEMIKKFKPVMYIEDDREDKSRALREYIVRLGYKIEEHNVPLFNGTNFRGERHNVFGGCVSRNVLCVMG